ncbi:hypothetical protein J8J14_04845 [Roseomonas sp. SSH11]|uniref:Uncharacterized protein n=1 Tax=Pararoseomonas baculiformis TaxID=2820812 RepID=A0ABS4ACX6_9PROT|nr:hypothetical protein [Pararoseomonas baculiformis]MBP0444099.1 hypothetical protein [Pararoseomonas baculiformis]
MPSASDLKLFDALATVSRAFAEGRLVPAGDDGDVPAEAAPAAGMLQAMDEESRAVLGEAALAAAYGAFAADGGEAGAMHMLVGAIGLMAASAGEDVDPPEDILSVLADGERVEAEIDQAGEAVDAEFGRDASAEQLAAALESRILGTAITWAGCTLPDGQEGQAAIRLRAARLLTRLAAGLMSMNAVDQASA